jgi:DHA1 family inner membrane transport protein
LDRKITLALLSLAAAYFVVGTTSLLVVAISAPLATDLQVSPAAVANLLTIFALTFAVAAPLAQVLLGQLPRRRLLMAGLAVLSGATALAALVDGYWQLFALRIAAGAGAALVGPMASAIGAGLVRPEQQGRALALVFSGMMLATVLGVPLAAWLGGWLGWRWVFLLVGTVGIAATVAVAALVHDRSHGAAVTLPGLLNVLTTRRTGMSVATTLLQMAAQFATYALIVPFVLERMGGTDAWAVAILFAFGVGGLLGNVVAGSMADRLGADRTIWTSFAGLAVVFALLLAAPAHAWIALALAIAWAVTGTMFQAPQQKRLVGLSPEARGLLLACNASALYIGMAAGAFIAGVAYESLGIAVLPAISLALMGVAALAFRQSLLR